MTQQVLYATSNGAIMQWQDTAVFSYPDPPSRNGNARCYRAAQWATQTTPQYVSNGALVDGKRRQLRRRCSAQQATKLYNAGCAITSTSTAALGGTYAVAGNAMSTIFAEMISILTNNTFTNGTASLDYPDTSRHAAHFTMAQFKTLATALGLFGNTCTAIIVEQCWTLPTQPAIIP